MPALVPINRRLVRRVAQGGGAIAAGLLLSVAVTTSAGAAGGSPTTTTNQPAAQAPSTGSKANGWLSLAAILFGAGISAALVITVSKDRRQSREKVIEALRMGASEVAQSDTPLAGALAGGGPPGSDLTVTADHESIQVGSTATLTAAFGNQPLACTWAFQPAEVVSPSGDGPNANLVVTGVKAGSVTATATWANPTAGATPPFRTGTKQLTVTASKSPSVNFSILGAGLGSSLLALLAISGAIALAFRGAFSAEVGTLLGTALGAGAAGAVSATHSPNSSNQAAKPPPNPPS